MRTVGDEEKIAVKWTIDRCQRMKKEDSRHVCATAGHIDQPKRANAPGWVTRTRRVGDEQREKQWDKGKL